ncbi:MAG TPA: NAD-dependent epimerase/dehydratase family protein [Chitinophagaceae bacterium]|nr:NAD-dependent epimerase/dehydratase family protein [Chitinophagaceae bacterium]
MNKILITGGRGFIGSHLCKQINGYDVIDLKEGKDICKEKIGKYEVIINLAAVSSIPESYRDELKCFETNVFGVHHLISQAPEALFIHISTSAVHGDSPYSVTKKLSEPLVDGRGIILRPCNVFGQGALEPSVIASFANAMKSGKDVHIEGTGEQRRDFVYVGDLVNQIIHHVNNPVLGTYDVGYGKNITINDLFKLMAAHFGYKKMPVYVDPRQGDIFENLAKNELFGDVIGFEDGLKKTLDSYL